MPATVYDLAQAGLVVSRLRDPSRLAPELSPFDRVFRLWCWPWDGAYEAHTVYRTWPPARDRPTKSCIARQVRWHGQLRVEIVGAAKLTQPVPEVEVPDVDVVWADRPVDIAWLDSRLARLEDMQLSLSGSHADSGLLDGVRFGFDLFRGCEQVTVEWWNDGPTHWKPIVVWAADTRRCLLEQFSK